MAVNRGGERTSLNTRSGTSRRRTKNMPMWYCLVSSLVSSNTSFRSTDELYEAARAWQMIHAMQ